ncbi:MAG: hypothetical protein ACE5IH_09565 [Thermodesulfobacteriota bacterium]
MKERYGVLICYSLSKAKPTPAEWTKFRKKFLGYLDHSNKGKYKYHRKGLMSEIPHIKLLRAVFIVRERDMQKVMDFLKGYKAEIHVRKVVLTHEDVEKLQK